MYITNYALDEKQHEYLESIILTQEELEAIENDEQDYLNTMDKVKLIKALFTLSKAENAYARLREWKDVFDGDDFKEIMSCPYMQLDRTATDLYKYMYDTSIIDDQNYMYFEVLSGKLNDWDFWSRKFEGLSTTQILEMIHTSYNNIFVAQNINPYTLGLVTLTEEQDEYIFSKLAEGEKVDFLFAETPCINVLPDRILDLMMNDHLDKSMAGYYFKIVYHMTTMILDNSNDPDTMTYIDFWKFVSEYCEKFELSYVDTAKAMDLDNLPKLIRFIECSYGIGKSFSEIIEVAINNIMTINYPYTILKSIYEGIDIDCFNDPNIVLSQLRVADYLDDDKMGLVLSYYLHPMFNTSDYIFKYPFPHGFPIVYNTVTKKLLLGAVVTDIDSGKPFGFVDDYLIAESVDDNIFKNFSSIDDYKEFIYAADDLRKAIKKFELNYSEEVNRKEKE